MEKRIFVRADIPESKDDRKAFVTDGLEAGVVSFILRKGDEQFATLGRMEDIVYFENGKPIDEKWAYARIDTPEEQSAVLAMAGKKDAVVIETGDWTVIPLENMIAKFRTAGTKIYAVARSKEDASLYLQTMEKGVDGVVIETDDSGDVSKFKDLLTVSEPVELSEVEVTSVKPIEMGDRVCVDTCSNMVPGEGMLVGSYSNCLFLIQSESEENGYVAARPFRVNAGAVHEYCMVPGGGTRYLSEVSAGDSVLVCDRDGNTRTASVGRCKVEVRPLLMVEATDGRKKYNVVLQNAETIKVVTSSGSKSVTTIVPGDRILAHLSTGGRHFGMAVEETITEK
ncbi:MAG: 3-dehydroquinate synthase [Thermoplasmata archaeon]|nr:3-dehydroquinate synthase [Thermoplasmata archaeon]